MLNFLTTTTVCGFSLYHVLAFFLIYSCTGWCLEVIFAAATTGQLVNRGFLNGPVCPIYGFGMIIVLFTLTPLQDSVLLLYIGGVILPSALELVGGWALYKLYHTRWWDYSDFPFNIGGYICLEFSLLWGVGTLVVMRIVHPVVAGLVDMVPPFVGFVVMCVLYAVYAADVVVTAFAASGLAKTLDAMEQLADSIHAVSDAMTQLLGTTTLNDDQKLYEEAAGEAGMDVKQFMRVQQLERENARYQRQQAELAQRRQMDQAYQRLMQEADGVKAQYPAFDLNAEMQDPDFVRLLRAQVPLKTIYEVRHQDEILGGAMQYTAQKVAAKVAAGVSANRGRPAENGAAASGASGARFDVEHSTKEQRMALIRRAANGERIEF